MKYRIVVDYDAPALGEYGFSNTVAQKHVEKALGQYLDSLDNFRISQIAKIYGIESANTVRPV